MIFYFLTLIFIIIIKSIRCSMILDSVSQNTIYVSEYCPTQKYCKEGTHVMCMYYDHNREFGPRCGNPVHLEITTAMVEKILDYVNEVRGRIASGTEKGMNNELLPKAYGMMKIEWDRELATLAQVLANQCLGGREDVCRATERFPNPSQSIAIIHFKYPDWEYLRNNNTEKGLNEEKLTFALQRFIKSAHALKKTVTKDIITDCPPLHELPDVNSKYYLNLIRGSATHIGCGLSAYSKYKAEEGKESIQNSVQVVCNISDGPQPSQPLYNTDPPFPGGSVSKRCGCPRGYRETRSCLCEQDSAYMWKSSVAASIPGYLNIQPTFKYKKLKDPIIKLQSFRPLMERGRLQVKSESQEDGKIDSSKSSEQGTHSDEQVDEVKSIQPILPIKQQHTLLDKYVPLEKSNIDENVGGEKPKAYFRTQNITYDENDSRIHLKNIKSEDQYKEMKKVMPPKRKYVQARFTYVKNVPVEPDIPKPMISQNRQQVKPVNVAVEDVLNVDEEPVPEGPLNVAEENLVDNYQYSNNKKVHANKRNKEPNKLLYILNILEQEVKNTQFDTKLQQEFDAKMQKIYEFAVPPENAPPQREIISQLGEMDKKFQDIKYKMDTDKNIEDEIVTLRRQPDRSQKNAVKRAHDDSEIITERSYDYVDQKNPSESTEPRYVSSMDNPYEEMLTKKTNYKSNQNNRSTERRQSDFKYNDILDGKVNLDRQYYSNKDETSRSYVSRDQATLTPDNDMLVRKTILSKALEDTDNIDKYEGKNMLLINPTPIENRINKRLIYPQDKIKLTKSPARKLFLVPERRAQFTPTFRQTNNNGELRPMKLLRPKFEDMSSRYPFQRQMSYLSDRDQQQN